MTGVSAAHRASVGETGALDLTCLAVWPSHGQLRVLGCLITLSGVESVLAVCGAKIAGIDASILTYRYLLRALGAAAALVKGNDASVAATTIQGDLGALPQDADRVGPQRLLPGPTYRTPWDQHALLSAIRQPTPTPWWQRHTPAALSRHMCPVHRCIRCSRARRRCAGCSL